MANPRKEFSKIFDKYINKIYRFVFLKVNSEEIAQDLCSETFLRGWEVYKDTQNPPKQSLAFARDATGQAKSKTQKIENPQAFLYKIARNLVTDYYREKGRTQIVSTENAAIIDPNPGIEEKIALNSDIDQIRAVLADLKEDYQNVIIWRYLDDLSIPEVAKMLDKSEETTRVTLHRALKALRNEMSRIQTS